MEAKKYQWRMVSLAKGINPDAAIAELERIETVFGALTPENVVEASQHEGSVLHNLFEWNDARAAHGYRLQQARSILNNIEIKVISDGQPRNIPVFEVVKRDNENVYKSISDFTNDDILQLKKNAIREMNYWKNKLSFYKEFQGAAEKLNDVIKDLDK